MLVELENGNLKGSIESIYQSGFLESHIVRVRTNDAKIIRTYHLPYERTKLPYFYIMSFGNLTQAEKKLIELLEYPEWTVLKYC